MTRAQKIRRHYEEIWGVPASQCQFRKGPIAELPSDFGALSFEPHGGREMWTYATRGMSLPSDENPLELHMFSSIETEEIVELLFATAHFHRTGERLGLWHTVNFGKPWQGNSKCDHGLVSLPYLDGPNLENCNMEGESVVKCYWLIPITLAEVEFKRRHGIEALEEQFERKNFDYLNPKRSSVV